MNIERFQKFESLLRTARETAASVLSLGEILHEGDFVTKIEQPTAERFLKQRQSQLKRQMDAVIALWVECSEDFDTLEQEGL